MTLWLASIAAHHGRVKRIYGHGTFGLLGLTKGPKTETSLERNVLRVVFYAVVSGDIHQVIEFFKTPAEAEAMVEMVLEDEPDLEDLLWVEPVELVSGGRN